MPPQSRVTDPHTGPCTMGAPSPILPPCAVTVLVCALPAARVGDQSMTITPPAPPAPHPFVKGSMTVLICSMPALRIGDLCAGGGAVVMGAPTVITGG